MSKLYNNITPGPKEPTPQDGWFNTASYDAARIKLIQDTIGGGNAVTKMGTSIPTPFARLILFNTAFEQIQTHNDTTVYGRLVSECLDMLEFVFNYGNVLTIKTWNIQGQIKTLKASASAKHHLLARSLQSFADELRVNGTAIQNIYLIYYQNQLVGGTSPYTLVYTSPNWQRNNISHLQGVAGNPLFADYADRKVMPCPLHDRDKAFREFLTDFYVAFGPVMAHNAALKRYIYENATAGYDTEMQAYYNSISGTQTFSSVDFMAKYDLLKDALGTALDVCSLGGMQMLPIGYMKAATVTTAVATDYELVPTSQRWQKLYPNMNAPLTLSEGGITGASYIGQNGWQAGTPLPFAAGTSLDQRVLPGVGNITYPYLTADDFLEDQLIKLDGELNSKAFNTLGLGQYLPPLKPFFFEFFNLADINSVPNIALSLTEEDNGQVCVTLRLPVKYALQPYIELTKKYHPEQVVTTAVEDSFSLLVFPSYKIATSEVPNRYSVLRYDYKDRPTLQLTYYAVTADHVAPLSNVLNTPRAKLGISYDTIGEAFDLIQVNWCGVSALLLPSFKEVSPDNIANDYVAGIDFGTTNSYVCLSENKGVNPQSLQFSKNQPQVLSLLEHDGFVTCHAANIREFAPAVLGPDCDTAFPYRTVIFENKTNLTPSTSLNAFHLFADANIGFNYLKENIGRATYKENGEYITTIKWDMENKRSNANDLTLLQNRVGVFCREVAWMIKNAIMLGNNPCVHFNVKLTFPHTMSRPTRNAIMQEWREAFDYVMGRGNVNIDKMMESIAPYYALIGSDRMTHTCNVINIDVGGGTTDMLFADVKNRRLMYDSSLFAGNDLWGNGTQLVQGQQTTPNGFVTLFETALLQKLAQTNYNYYKEIAPQSADKMSYVFKNDATFNFTSILQNNAKLMPILYVHLGALCCHIAQVIVKEQMELPRIISFTGQGAKYLQIISSEPDDITDLMRHFIEVFLPDGMRFDRNFKVQFQSNCKEVTAQGAILEDNPALLAISKFDQEEICVSGIASDPQTYGETQSEDVKYEVMQAFDTFCTQFLKNESIRRYLKSEFEIEITDSFVQALIQGAEKGFDDMSKSKESTEELNEAVFFWPFKNALYEASLA